MRQREAPRGKSYDFRSCLLQIKRLRGVKKFNDKWMSGCHENRSFGPPGLDLGGFWRRLILNVSRSSKKSTHNLKKSNILAPKVESVATLGGGPVIGGSWFPDVPGVWGSSYIGDICA